MKIAVITGASSGMGREFVLQLSKEKADLDEIWVIARRKERLEALASLVPQKIRVLPMDLTVEESFDTYSTLLKEEKPDVKVLVNASGYGVFGYFEEQSLETQNNMMLLNMNAYVKMTYLTLPYMDKGSEIYHISSLSAFQPVPAITIYAATKSFVLSFSQGIREEVKGRGIKVLAVCPFWTKTEFFDRAATDDTISYYSVKYEPHDVIAKAIKDMRKGKRKSLYGFMSKATVFLSNHLPYGCVMGIWNKQQKLRPSKKKENL